MLSVPAGHHADDDRDAQRDLELTIWHASRIAP
jgi:hypothetical protein